MSQSSIHSLPSLKQQRLSRRPKASTRNGRWIISLTLATGLLPLHGQVTVAVVAEASGSPGTVNLRTLEPAVIRGGKIAFTADTHEAQFNSRRIIRLNGSDAVQGSGPTPGTAAPGTGSTFSSLIPDELFVNSAGRVAFKGNTEDDRNFGFWAGDPDSLQLVARHGAPAPGTNGNFDIGYPGRTTGTLLGYNDAGQVAFSAAIQDAPTETAYGVWAGSASALQLVAREGSQVPAFASGVTWRSLQGIQINSAGQVGVYGRITQIPPSDTSLTTGSVLMVGLPGALRIVAKAGEPAPDAEPNTFLRLSDPWFMLNPAGEAVYLSDIWSGKYGVIPSSKGIYVGTAAGSRLVARTGFPAPGTTDNALFIDFDKPVINATGEVAFISFVESAANPVGKGIWTGKPGRLRKIARTDDVAPGTGGQLFGDFTQDGVVISDSGQVAFVATYSPGGGLYGNGATSGLFATDKAGTLQLVVREGTAYGNGPVLREPQLTDSSLRPGSCDSRRTSFDQNGRLVFYADGFDNNTQANRQFNFLASFPESAPVILPTGQPVSVRAEAGGGAVFEVVAMGSRPATYQWKRNGVNIPGATSATLTLASLTTAERGTYTVVVTNPRGSLTSAPAQLSFPPVLTKQLQDQQANAGTTVTLSAAATGPAPLTWQWQFQAAGAPDFTNLPGSENSILTLSSIAAAQAGRYRAIITNSDGSTTSREAVLTVAAAGAPLVKRIFIPGDPAPGISGTLAFSMGEYPVINNAGEIAFEGKVGTDPSGAGAGTYLRSPEGQYQFVLGGGRQINLCDSGALSQTNSRTMWQGPANGMRILASAGAEAPDGAGFYANDAGSAMADNGTAAFLFGTHLSNYALFTGKPDAVRLVGRSNVQAPGLAAGTLFEWTGDPVTSPSGTVAFWASLKGPGITEDNNTSLWKGTAAGAQRLVAEDDLVPAAGSGVRVGEIRTPDSDKPPFGWNEAGQVAFSTTLAGAGITSANDRAILAGTSGALAIAARTGVANGHTFSFPRAPYPLINRTGQVAFVATVTPTGGSEFLESVWRWTPGPGGGTRQLIAREGQQAPGLAAGIVMDSDLIGRPLFALSLNGAGQMVLMTRLAGPGISFDDQNDVALYLTNPAGELKFIARTGSMIDLGGGEQRELGYLTITLGSGGEDGRQRCLTESGEVVFMGALKKPGSFALDYGLFTARLAPDTTAFTTSYNTWAAATFPAGTPAAQTLPGADCDSDNIPNSIEFLMASSPCAAGGSAVQLQQVTPGLRITFPRRAGVPDGMEIIETTLDLASTWKPVGRTAVKRTDNSPGLPQTVTVELPEGEGQRFVRVRIVPF